MSAALNFNLFLNNFQSLKTKTSPNNAIFFFSHFYEVALTENLKVSVCSEINQKLIHEF